MAQGEVEGADRKAPIVAGGKGYIMRLLISDSFCTYKYDIPHDGSKPIRAAYLAVANLLGAEAVNGVKVEQDALTAASSRVEQLREAIEAQPHGGMCEMRYEANGDCDCWKAKALADDAKEGM